MFEKSRFDILADYIASGCSMELTDEELDYYNALYAMVAIDRREGKDNAIAFLMHQPFGVERARARQMYAEAINLFHLPDKEIENDAYRAVIFDNLMKASLAVLQNASCAKDFEVYGNLQTQAAKIKGLMNPDPVKPKEPGEKPIVHYDLTPGAVGLPDANRNLLAAQIDGLRDIPAREKTRLRRDAGVEDVDIEEMLDDQEEKTKDYR
ncbi:MAG: hypothetical protein LBN29_11405 [Mediterranea sp.]|jgi:hypothetical protein|nr:hypothetical protein [Mediterranea sp.]